MTDRIIHVTYTPLHFFLWLTEANPLVWTAHLCTQRQGHLLNILRYFGGSFIPHRCWMRAHITNTSGGFLDWGVCDFVKSACQAPSPKWLYNQLLHAHAHTKRKPILPCKKLRCYYRRQTKEHLVPGATEKMGSAAHFRCADPEPGAVLSDGKRGLCKESTQDWIWIVVKFPHLKC